MYLGPEDLDRLARLARQEGVSQAEIIRRALASYLPQGAGDRRFALARVAEGDGASVLDVPEDRLLAGLGA